MKFELFTGRFPEDSEVEIAFYSTDDTTCSNTRAYTLKAGVNMYKVGDAPNVSEGVGEKINFTVSYIELAPNTALFTNNFNDSVECDQTNWTTNTFKDVTGLNCGQTSNVNFQIPALNQLVYYLASVKTVGDQFRAHMGWCSIGACNSEATRPIDIDLYAPFYLTKQTE
ncbi:MAG: hypothetical protein HON90_11985 [Halobacteriovoraceae bacterium]|nr:hypothetical protein [Halobacteriovoraceae bacterium]